MIPRAPHKGATPQRARGGKPRKKKHPPRPKKLSQQDLFLREYGRCGVIGWACEQVGIDRKRHYNWLKDDPAYVERFGEAKQIAREVLVREAVRRGVEGIDEPVFGTLEGKNAGSGIVGYKRVWSDRLLALLLAAKVPEFRTRVLIGGVDDSPPVRTEDMTDQRAAELYQQKLKRRQ